jgi:hypothetical protein
MHQHHSSVYEIRFAMPSEELNEYTLTGVKEWLKSHHAPQKNGAQKQTIKTKLYISIV